MTAPSRKHLPAMDGLRGIAILMVLVVHFYRRELFADSPFVSMATGRLAGAGGYGVQLFFVLSGFLITGILVDNRDEPGSLFKFYVRRCLRIFPLYYLCLSILFLVLPQVCSLDEGARRIQEQQAWAWTYLLNWPTLGWIWDDSKLYLIGHFWSLCVEEHFYLFWPFIVYIISRNRLALACVSMVFISLAARYVNLRFGPGTPILLQWKTVQCLDGLAVGGLLAIALRNPRMTRFVPTGRTHHLLLALTGVWALTHIAQPRSFHPPALDAISESVIILFFGLLVLATLRTQFAEKLNQILTSPWLISLGKYSYGLYVIHGLLRPHFQAMFPVNDWPKFLLSPLLYQILFYVLAGGLSYLLAYGSYHCFEKHFLALKRYVEYQRSPRREQPVRP